MCSHKTRGLARTDFIEKIQPGLVAEMKKNGTYDEADRSVRLRAVGTNTVRGSLPATKERLCRCKKK